MNTYHGSCHCRTVRFEIKADLSRLEHCNCSICIKKGALFTYAAPSDFRLLQGESALSLYQFNTKVSSHFFCRHCGIHTFGHPRSSPDNYIVNVRCLDDFDLDEADYELGLFDGRNWEEYMENRKGNASTSV